MVLGLSELLQPLSSLRGHSCPTVSTDKVTSVVDSVLADLGPVPSGLRAEVTEVLHEEARFGEKHLRYCASFLERHLATVRVEHSVAEATPIAMEAMRIEGLKAIKKWRAWQAFKSADRIDALACFMNAKPDCGSLVLELPKLMPDDPLPEATRQRVYAETVWRIAEEIEEIHSADGANLLAMEIISRFDTLTQKETEEPLVQLGASMCYVIERIRTKLSKNWHLCDFAILSKRLLGSADDYSRWRKSRKEKEAAARAKLVLIGSGREPVPELDTLRTTDSQCSECGGQTYLVEERIRRSDEPSDFFRLCPACNTVTRPAA